MGNFNRFYSYTTKHLHLAYLSWTQCMSQQQNAECVAVCGHQGWGLIHYWRDCWVKVTERRCLPSFVFRKRFVLFTKTTLLSVILCFPRFLSRLFRLGGHEMMMFVDGDANRYSLTDLQNVLGVRRKRDVKSPLLHVRWHV